MIQQNSLFGESEHKNWHHVQPHGEAAREIHNGLVFPALNFWAETAELTVGHGRKDGKQEGLVS